MPLTRAYRWLARSLLVVSLLCFSAPARADNLADEAEVEFELGADHYKANDFRAALEHFLASNRLVSNRNVVFNIARTYEQLKQSADAYRYYTQALEGETDKATRRRVAEAIARVSPLVAVLRVQTDPPGATVFLDRKDLGARGNTPLALGLGTGTHKVLVELAGYDPAEAEAVSVSVGAEKVVALHLTQIVGTVRVDGEPPGASIRVDTEEAPVIGTVPTILTLTPGRHTLLVSKEGFVTAPVPIDVPAKGRTVVQAKLAPISGNLVVSSDMRDGLVEIDGRMMGYTPAVLNIPVGTHKVSVSLAGFRPFVQTVVVSATSQAHVDAQLTQVEEVTAASRVTESVDTAPSSVSIITGEELRAMGYPTIAEALRGIRGVYISDDSTYTSVGFRGFSQPGDYSSRVLVLVDGMSANDNYVGSSYVGYDGRVDLADIERIEVVRGPGSVLYGTGAFFGVINLVTRSRDAPTHGEAGVSASGAGVGTARVAAQLRFSPESGAWASASVAHGSGSDYFFKEYASDPATHGYARGIDGFDAATTQGRFWYQAFTLQWFMTSRKKTLPSAEYATVFGDGREHFSDTRGFLEAKFEPVISKRFQVLSRAYMNMYNFDDFLPYYVEQGGNATEEFRGIWGGVEERLVFTPIEAVRLTAGGELQRHFRTFQEGVSAGPPAAVYLDRNDPYTVAAGYILGDITPKPWFKASAGLRLDYYTNFGSSLNPRLALILKPYEKGNLKIMAGKAFRAPSVYEHYYEGPTQTPGGNTLTPEQIYSGEVEFTHRFTSTWSGIVAGYTNYITDLIVLGGDGTFSNPNQYVNSTLPVLSVGGELEVRREWRDGWMIAANYAYQQTRYVGTSVAGYRHVPNSPDHLGSVKGAIPIIGRTLRIMSRLSLEGPRYDRNDQAGDPPQLETNPVAIWDIVLSGEIERYGVRYNLGLYNAMDYKYSLPVSSEFTQDFMIQNGRTLLANVAVSF